MCLSQLVRSNEKQQCIIETDDADAFQRSDEQNMCRAGVVSSKSPITRCILHVSINVPLIDHSIQAVPVYWFVIFAAELPPCSIQLFQYHVPEKPGSLSR